MSVPGLSGRLLKQGSVSWKARFFELKDCKLSYFVKEGDTKRKGQLILTASTTVKPTNKKPHSFQIEADDRLLTLAADSAEDMDRWQKAVMTHVAFLANKGDATLEDDDDTIRTSRAEEEEEEEEGWQLLRVGDQDFEISEKYEMIKPIGHGAYGVVISAMDHKSGGKVAIKKIPDTFEDFVDAKRIVREIHLLRHFDHENVIHVVDLFFPPTQGSDFDDTYIVTDLMETDLHRVIYSKQDLTTEHIQYMLYQMFCGLHYIHSAHVIHRDLKPSNILINSNCDLKLCDFGLARGINEDEDLPELTEYVVTRWYRAPEIMLSCPTYDGQIDVWAIVCIFCEMMMKKPIFPGDHYMDQLKKIIKVVGRPKAPDLGFVTNHKARNFLLKLADYPKVNLQDKFRELPASGIHLMENLLNIDPGRRYSVREALEHPFFKDVRDKGCEGKANFHIDWKSIEQCELSKKNLQELLMRDYDANIQRVDSGLISL